MKLIRLEDYEEELIEKSARTLIRFTCQIFTRKGNRDKLTSDGSAVLIKINDERLLVSAAHVVNSDRISELFVRTTEGFINLSRINKELQYTGNKYADADVSVIRIKEVYHKLLLREYSFLDINEIDINHRFSLDLNYIVFGFPSTRTKYDPENRVYKIKPFNYIADPKDVELEDKLIPTLNFKVRITKKVWNSIGNNLITKPDLFGMSGCGIWCLKTPIINESEKPILHLVGIMTELKRRDLMVGTYISAITEMLRITTNLSIPKARYINITLN